MKRWFLILAIAALPHTHAATPAADAAPPDIVTVERVRKDGRSYYEISARGFARATPEATWRVLTDYGRLAEFVPNLASSRIVSRTGDEAIVEQTAKAGFLFISHSVRMVLHVIEKPISVIDITLVSGDMKHYASHWEVMPAQHDGTAGTLILYTGSIEPDFFVPPLLGPPMIRSDMRRMLAAVIQEIEAAQRASRAPDQAKAIDRSPS